MPWQYAFTVFSDFPCRRRYSQNPSSILRPSPVINYVALRFSAGRINYVASTCSITRMTGRFCNIIYLMVRDMPGAGRRRGRRIPAPGCRGFSIRSEPLHDAGGQLVLDALLQFRIHAAVGLAILVVEDPCGPQRYVAVEVPEHLGHRIRVATGRGADGVIGQQLLFRDIALSFHLTPPSASSTR